MAKLNWLAVCLAASMMLISEPAFAHAIAEGDKGYIQEVFGVHLVPFAYLGAKHMVTGYDHVLFLFAVIFFLYRLKDIAIYVTLFCRGPLRHHAAGGAARFRDQQLSD